MYIPEPFVERNADTLWQTIERYSFAVLFTQDAEGPVASHLPLVPERTGSGGPALLGHFARANPQWRTAAGQPALAVFSGPHAYVSPRWYAPGPAVPTWNYLAVHATGRIELMEDRDELLGLLEQMVARYESSAAEPWTFDRQAPFARRLAEQIVGFRLVIDRLEGKWKLSQNKPLASRRRVAEALASSGQAGEQALGLAMYESLGGLSARGSAISTAPGEPG